MQHWTAKIMNFSVFKFRKIILLPLVSFKMNEKLPLKSNKESSCVPTKRHEWKTHVQDDLLNLSWTRREFLYFIVETKFNICNPLTLKDQSASTVWIKVESCEPTALSLFRKVFIGK